MKSQKYHIWPQPKCGLCQLRYFIYIISKPNLYFSISVCREEHSWFWGISLVQTLFDRDISFKCPQLIKSKKYHIWPQPKCCLFQLRYFIYIISKPNLYFTISLCRGRAFLVLRHLLGPNFIWPGRIFQMPPTHEISKNCEDIKSSNHTQFKHFKIQSLNIWGHQHSIIHYLSTSTSNYALSEYINIQSRTIWVHQHPITHYHSLHLFFNSLLQNSQLGTIWVHQTPITHWYSTWTTNHTLSKDINIQSHTLWENQHPMTHFLWTSKSNHVLFEYIKSNHALNLLFLIVNSKIVNSGGF